MRDPPPPRLDDAFRRAMVDICGTAHVLTDATACATYRSDAQRRHRQTPEMVVLPGSAEQVAAVLEACARAGVPWVPRGAGTGLSGGAVAAPGCLLVVLGRLRRILAVELDDDRVIVEPGATRLAIGRAVAPSHRYPSGPTNPWAGTIGGDVAENAGGAHSLKHGVTGDAVIGLDVVLADGRQVHLRHGQPGYDLISALIGSEGTLGIVVAVHLQVVPVTESVRTLLAYFDTASDAGAAASAIIATGAVPAALELLDGVALAAAAEAVDVGLRGDAGAALLIEFDGPREDCANHLENAAGLCVRAGARDMEVALDATQRARLWAPAAVAYAALRRRSGAYDVGDAVVPRPRLAAVLGRISALSSEFGLTVAHLWHAGEGNLHPMICFDPASPAEADRAGELSDRILDVCLDAGGSIAGEHGIGLEKLTHMAGMYTAADLDAFADLARAFDPRGLANPGKLLTGA